MVIIKKLSFLLVAIMIVAVFAGCTKPVESSEASPFSLYRIEDGVRISLGDKRDDIEKLVYGSQRITIEFEDETPEDQVFELVQQDDVAFEYDRAGNLLGLHARGSNWKIANGLKVTDSAEDVKKNYPAEYMHTYKNNADIYFSLDENGDVIEFAEDAPYILRFDIEQHAVYRIIIKKNVQ